ncbi:MAG: CoA ester lyase [Thaumarchaeota archaeon]|nr:CoA ester lyase [Nitrososphaerota archaeon]
MRRSQLFVPGNMERMIQKSRLLGADSIILDLEDAVPAGQKEKARALVSKSVSEVEWGRRELCVRINSPSSRQGRADIARLGSLDRLDTFVIPKAEGDLSTIHRSTGKRLIPIIETAKGLSGIDLVTGSGGVDAVAYGAADFSLSVAGSVSEYLDNVYVKTKIVVAARSTGIDPIDNVFFDLKDMSGFEKSARQARALGFSGKQVVHPSQIRTANRVFSPSREELKWARKVLGAYNKSSRSGKGAIALEGALVDEVHRKLAKRMLDDSSTAD